MKLASIKNGRDGTLVVVSRDLAQCATAEDIAPTMQDALDNWKVSAPKLRALAEKLENGKANSIDFDQSKAHSPLPRAYQWADGSAYINHVELVRKARGAEVPESFYSDPLMYQGGSDGFLAPHENIQLADPAWGCDMEGEIAVVTDDVPMGVSAEAALKHIKLIMLVNDVSLRGLIPASLARGSAFSSQSRPAPFRRLPLPLTSWATLGRMALSTFPSRSITMASRSGAPKRVRTRPSVWPIWLPMPPRRGSLAQVRSSVRAPCRTKARMADRASPSAKVVAAIAASPKSA